MIAERRYEPEGKVGLRVVDEQEGLPRLVGCMTDAAGDVEFYLGEIDYPAHVTRFLRKMQFLSFKQAGYYRKRKYQNPGGWCFFTVEKWAEMLRMDKGQVQHIRARLVAEGIITYQPNLTGEYDLDGEVADGRLIWNLTFAEWKPLQGEPVPYNHGGARQGAGRPRKKQPTNANLKNVRVANKEAGNANLKAENTLPENQVCTASLDTTPATPESGLDYKQKSSLHCPVDKFALVASSEVRQEVVAEVAVINVEKKEEYEESTKAPEALEADASDAFCWPPRQEREKDLDYYQRILKEHEKQRVALLTRMAYERIGSDPGAYSRIGSLAKKCGAALLAKYILQAAASHIDGDDPLSYLTKIVNRQEGTHGTRTGTVKRATYNQQAKAGGNHQGTGSDDGNGWAGWDVTFESV